MAAVSGVPQELLAIDKMNKWFILIWLAFGIGCSKDQSIHKLPKKVPLVYINAADSNFLYLQDTVYYKQKRFNGLQFQLYPNGDTAVIRSFYNGLEEGYSKKWHPNKRLAEQRLYIDGKKEGIHLAWWSNGNLKLKYSLLNDEFDGLCKEWYANGMIFKEFNYKAGHEEGSIKMFWENGKVKANYVIKKGRRYGLLGTKNCINVADSIAFER